MNVLLCDSIKESFAYVSSNAARTAISKLLRPSEVLESSRNKNALWLWRLHLSAVWLAILKDDSHALCGSFVLLTVCRRLLVAEVKCHYPPSQCLKYPLIGGGGDMLSQAHIYSSCCRDNRGVVKPIVSKREEMLMNFVQRNILFRVYSGHFQSSTKKMKTLATIFEK